MLKVRSKGATLRKNHLSTLYMVPFLNYKPSLKTFQLHLVYTIHLQLFKGNKTVGLKRDYFALFSPW